MTYITGDTHGGTSNILKMINRLNLSENDIIIILGDAGYNYYLDERDYIAKNKFKKIKPTIFCIQGNHECRPEHIETYKTKEWHGGTVWYEEKYPKLLFAKDGDVYEFDGLKCLVIGGAYSIDKMWRIIRNVNWWSDEQPSDEIKNRCEETIKKNHIDIVLSHTCPFRYEPKDTFIPGIDQSKVDKSTEIWLDSIEGKIDYKAWYCGHFHINRDIDKIHFLYHDIKTFDEIKQK